MKYTENYNLYKPDYDDTIDVNYLNQNMDVLDNTVHGLNYIQNVNTSNTGVTFIKRDGQQIDVPLNYLKLTGGTVTGNVEVTGKLTNNGKNIGRLFKNVNPILTPLIDFDEMAKTRGTEKATVQTKQNGQSISISYYTWCKFSDYMSSVYFEQGDIILKEPFTNYDKLLVVTLGSNANQSIRCNVIDCGMLDWYMNNLPIVPLTGSTGRGSGWWGVFPYKTWGTQTKTSTTTKLTTQGESTDMIQIYGIKYTEVK